MRLMKCPPRRFFWLLFWLGVGLMLLDALSFCVSFGTLERARKTRELATIKDLQVAMKGFESEYGRYPLVEANSTQDDLTIDSANSRFLGSLLGDNLQDNPRSITFVELPMAKAGRGGLVGEKGSFRLLDQWEHPYQIIMDANHDGKVWNPDRLNTNPKVQLGSAERLPLAVAVFSLGVDGVPYTEDDVTSWRSGPSTPRPEMIWPKNTLGLMGLLLTMIGAVGIILSRRKPAAHSVTE